MQAKTPRGKGRWEQKGPTGTNATVYRRHGIPRHSWPRWWAALDFSAVFGRFSTLAFPPKNGSAAQYQAKGGLRNMAEVLSKNARVGIVTQKFFCTCGGEIKMKLVFNKGKLRNTAECEKCHRQERKPSDFMA